MVDRNRKLNETAKALGVSPRVLQQYFSLKAAEVNLKQAKPESVSVQKRKFSREKPKA